MHERPVLVVTAVDDMTSDMVIAELNDRGVPVVRADPGQIGAGLTMSARFGTGVVSPAGGLATKSRSTDLGAIRSVYWRRPEWPTFDGLESHDARWAVAQVRHGVGGILYGLPECRYVNHPLRNYEAEFKPLQLAIAQRLGLTVPPTLVSNEVREVREFIGAHDQVIYKALRWVPYRQGEQGMSTWTEPVTVDEIDETVALVPHLFQARVDKIADIRVTIVGEKMFAVRIDSDLLDWRSDYAALSYSVTTLPDRLEKTLRAYLEHFGLAFGCFDLCLDRASEYHWLELNPNGQWGWLEDETGLPITAAFADLLQGTP